MTLLAITNKITGFLQQRDYVTFANKELGQILGITTTRISDVLNVLASVLILNRKNRNFIWKRCDIIHQFQAFYASLDSEGRNTSIFEHTKTVVFKLKSGHELDKDRRTYDVLAVLRALGVINKNRNWSLNGEPVNTSHLSLLPTYEVDTGLVYQFSFGYEFDL
ncbi:E2F/DP family winged-helix DNA-binding domain-containing protein [Spironucleus salmonicida]|uniref:E2F/DP family winged-helix DNA-binding domain-containing protein n=1 Tax=Spironucleus salmonicida TaxID=348837 RepID=V6LS70_9EUKA|nr:E2F/DP family winged-helix DNA-binding domain-containing protein [Spironucleus salmonicida]|eukprot:EST47507.1 E2F/DP family winged-helix DNA-binding domain-containing protein [Spironucleus salmonicida]